MIEKNLNKFEIEQLKKEIINLKNETILKCNNVLEILEYPPENLLLGTEIEWIYPYIILANIKLDIKTIEKYIKNPNAHGFRFFVSNYIEPVKTRFGNLSCPLYNDISLGIHNQFTFSEECLNDLINYYLEIDRENFIEFINENLRLILDLPSLKRKYNLSQNIESLNIDTNESIKRDIAIKYLIKIGLL